MRDIAIYGAGGFGREVACLIRQINEVEPKWNLIGFFDDVIPAGQRNEYGTILGGIDVLNAWPEPLDVMVAIGSAISIKKIVSCIRNNHVEFPNLLFNVTYADRDNFHIGKGNIVTGCHFSCAVDVGDFNVINGDVVFGHDVKVGSYNTFMPATRISGTVTIGNDNFFGVNAIVLQKIEIGDRVRLGAGSVLMHKPKADSLYIGNPAKIFKY